MKHSHARRLSLLTAPLAFLAGACSLSFEVLWTRQLVTDAGDPLAAFTIVVCSFMLGLATGAALLGRAADRARSPIRLFSLGQILAAALGGLSAHLAATGGLVRPAILGLRLESGGFGYLSVEILASGLVTLPVSFLMGGTLPLLLKGSGPPQGAGRQVGILAAANAAGAAAGSLACAFLMLPAAGLSRSLLLTSAACLLTSAIALAGSFAWPGLTATSRSVAFAGPVASLGPRPSPLAALFVAGAALTALEVSWTRLAHLSFGSSAQAGALVLAAVIAGLSAGNAAGSRLVSRGDPSTTLTALMCLAAISAAATDPLLGRLPLLAARLGHGTAMPQGSSWAFLSGQVSNFMLLLGLVGLPCLFLGAAFPVACRAAEGSGLRAATEGRLVGLASAATSAGNLVGAPVAFFGILSRYGSRGCLLMSAAALALAALLPAEAPRWKGRRRLAACSALLFVIGVAAISTWDPDLMSAGPFLYRALYDSALAQVGGEDLREALRRRGEVIFAREGPNALVTVRSLPGGLLSLQVNGKTDASTGGDMKTQTLTAQLPLLLHGAASGPDRKALIIGLGSGVSAGAALSHPLGSVVVVEISAEVAEAALFFEQANRGALRDPRTRLIIRDARTWLLFAQDGAGDRLYDIIASQPSNPWVAGQAILFTREFFSLAHEHLAPHGIMSQWVQGYGLDPEDFRSVVATFSSVFPHVSLWEESTSGGDYLLLGSDTRLRIHPAVLSSRMTIPSVAADLARIEMSGPADLLSHFVSDGDALAAYARGAPVQTEDRLSLEFTAPRALHRETLGGIVKSLEPYRRDPADLAEEDPDLAAELSRRARGARREREWAAGLGLLEAERGPDADLMRAVLYLRAGMQAHALRAVRELVLRRPSERLPHLMLAHLAMSSGRIHEAVEELETAVVLDPDDPRSRLYLARALYAAGRVESALAHNAAASRSDGSLAEAPSDRCAMLLAAGDPASAEAACLEALSLDSELAEAHANLGVTRARRGRLQEAEGSYRQALDLDPGLLDARFNLAALLGRLGRAEEGLDVLLGDHPGWAADAATLRLAARLAIQAGDRAAARTYLNNSLALDPGNEESTELARSLREDLKGPAWDRR